MAVTTHLIEVVCYEHKVNTAESKLGDYQKDVYSHTVV